MSSSAISNIKMTKLKADNNSLEKISPEQRKHFFMMSCMIRDNNFLSKLLFYANNSYSKTEPFKTANVTIMLFIIVNFIGKAYEMWIFIKSKEITKKRFLFDQKLIYDHNLICSFFNNTKLKNVFCFIRNKFGFHYDTYKDLDPYLNEAFSNIGGIEMWLSENSANEIFPTSNEIIEDVIINKMKQEGFNGTDEELFKELIHELQKSSSCIRDFCVNYLVETMNIQWHEEKIIQNLKVPTIESITLPLIVS